MGKKLTSDHVFQIAIGMEETGRAFYEAIAATCPRQPAADLCTRLAGKEAEHLDTFRELRDRLTPEMIQRPLNPQRALEFSEKIDSFVLPDAPAARARAAQGDLPALLEMAVAMEKASVVFYVGLLPLVSPEDATGILAIIDEEKSHTEEFKFALLEIESPS